VAVILSVVGYIVYMQIHSEKFKEQAEDAIIKICAEKRSNIKESDYIKYLRIYYRCCFIQNVVSVRSKSISEIQADSKKIALRDTQRMIDAVNRKGAIGNPS
jgi:hypothetical protein